MPTETALEREATEIALGDLDADNDNDVVLVDRLTDSLTIFRQGAGGELGNPEQLPLGGDGSEVEIVDIDGDGDRDIVVSAMFPGLVVFFHQQPDGTFARTSQSVPQAGVSFAIGD